MYKGMGMYKGSILQSLVKEIDHVNFFTCSNYLGVSSEAFHSLCWAQRLEGTWIG